MMNLIAFRRKWFCPDQDTVPSFAGQAGKSKIPLSA
jgi:hypothetical protein